jgi:light-independent protochlorophyllide reductase subunit N
MHARVRVLNYSGSGIETTFTEGEDACLASLVPSCPKPEPMSRPRCSWSARWPMWSRTSSPPVRSWASVSLPAGAQRRDHAAGRPGTRFLLAQPFLAETARALERAARAHLPRPSRSGEGTTAWLKAAAESFGVDRRAVRTEVAAAPPHAAPESAGPLSRALAGKRIFFFPDSASWKSRSPASCMPSWACSPSKSARPICTAHDGRELDAAARRGARSAKARMSSASWTAAAQRPDITVCGLGLANPLEAEGLTTKWSIELVFTPIQGFEQAGDLAELFARR